MFIMLKDIFIGILIGLLVLSGILVWRNTSWEISVNSSPLKKSSWSIFDKKQTKLDAKKKTKVDSIYTPILMYHYIRENPDPNDTLGYSLSITPANFSAQLDWLIENGYQTITLDELVAGLKGGYLSANKPVVLTFDDGYVDFYTAAFPELKKRNMKATVYMISGKIDDTEGRFLTSQQIKELSQSGLITIGSHSVSHINFANVSIANATKEAYQSKKKLEQIIGKKVINFCYPSGQFNDAAIKVLRSVGYSSGVTTAEGAIHSSESLLYLSRVRISGSTTIEKFREKITQY